MAVAKHIAKLFAYSSATGVQEYAVVSQNAKSVVRQSGISGELLLRTELDASTSRYFTTTRLAIEAFITRALTAIKDPAKRDSRADWKLALAKARLDLRRLA